MSNSWGIHWFRRDLRVMGNAALRANWERNQGRVLGIFCFDAVFLKRQDFSHNRFAFFMRTNGDAISQVSHDNIHFFVGPAY